MSELNIKCCVEDCGEIEISDNSLSCGTIDILFGSNGEYFGDDGNVTGVTIDKDDAIKIINHLKMQFNIK